jgi:hypothetical protein
LLPNVTEHFAADAGLDRLAPRHHPTRSGQDAGAQARQHIGDVVAAEVDAAAGTADALDAAISTFSRDDGMSTRVWRARVALRIRASMSAMGSVITL